MLIRNIMLGVCAILVSFQAVARNDVLSLDLEAALNTPAAQQKLNQGVSFYFGENSHPKVLKKVGDVKTSKKTNAFNKSDIRSLSVGFPVCHAGASGFGVASGRECRG